MWARLSGRRWSAAGPKSSLAEKSFPPGIEHGIDGVGGALADFRADLVDGGAFAGTQ